jgi:hypothetical protein
LSERERQDLLATWDERQESAFFTPEAPDTWDELPVVIGGRFIPAENPFIAPEWHADYFEYLLKYPELMLMEKPTRPLALGCIAHPEARETLRSGCIPAGFTCPLENADCPMRQLLAREPGHSFQLVGPVVGNRLPLTRRPSSCPT